MKESAFYKYLQDTSVINLFINDGVYTNGDIESIPYWSYDSLYDLALKRYRIQIPKDYHRKDIMRAILSKVHSLNETNDFLNYFLSLPELHKVTNGVIHCNQHYEYLGSEIINNCPELNTINSPESTVIKDTYQNVCIIYKYVLKKFLYILNGELVSFGVHLSLNNGFLSKEKDFSINRCKLDISNSINHEAITHKSLINLINTTKKDLRYNPMNAISDSEDILEKTVEIIAKHNDPSIKINNGTSIEYLEHKVVNNIHNESFRKKFNKLLSGINKSMSAIKAARNKSAHHHYNANDISEPESELIFNESIAISNYLLICCKH